jgi:predicted acetyltransferase
MELIKPSTVHLPSYVAALERAWLPDHLDQESTRNELDWISRDPNGFLSLTDNPEGQGPELRLPDGSRVQRLPSITRWMWDGEFCGRIQLRWQHGTTELPPTCLGHIGYAVVPWKRQRGFASLALSLILEDAVAVGLSYVDLTTNQDNLVSQRVIEKTRGQLIERFKKPDAFGGAPSYRFRIHLSDAVSPFG